MRSISAFFGATGSFWPAAAASTLPSSETAGLPSADTTSMPFSTRWRVERLHLLLRDVDLLEARGDLLVRQEPALLALGDEVAQLVELRERRLAVVGREVGLGLLR